VLQEGTDERGSRSAKSSALGRFVLCFGGEATKQAEGVPIRGDGVGARSRWAVSRSVKNASSVGARAVIARHPRWVAQSFCDELDQSGDAFKYQYESLGLTCPNTSTARRSAVSTSMPDWHHDRSAARGEECRRSGHGAFSSRLCRAGLDSEAVEGLPHGLRDQDLPRLG